MVKKNEELRMRITMQDSLQEQTEKTEAKENKHKPLLNTSVKFTRGFRGFTKPKFINIHFHSPLKKFQSLPVAKYCRIEFYFLSSRLRYDYNSYL